MEQFEIEVKFRSLTIKGKLKLRMIHKEVKNNTTHFTGQGKVKPHGSGDPKTLDSPVREE